MNYDIDELVKIAKRDGNTKRPYLYVDPLQGKHIPVSPGKSLGLFSELSRMLEKRYGGESLLVIGFAETATAVGAAAAIGADNVKYYLTTTREDVPGGEYLYFTEEHSHAAQQKLAMNGLGECLERTDRIVFAEDEVTTGNTIARLIEELKRSFPGKAKRFGIVSILNSMTDERLAELADNGIECDYVCRIPFEYRVGETENHTYNTGEQKPLSYGPRKDEAKIIPLERYCDCRTVLTTERLEADCRRFVCDAMSHITVRGGEEILVLGTEEFMYPAMLLGHSIEKYAKVWFHAVTRSPIETSADEDYPLHGRTELDSLYEAGRRTFLYDLRGYDTAIIVTDAYRLNSSGAAGLVNALAGFGNDNIIILHWGGDNSEKQLFRK